jgi:hypothetical protein
VTATLLLTVFGSFATRMCLRLLLTLATAHIDEGLASASA